MSLAARIKKEKLARIAAAREEAEARAAAAVEVARAKLEASARPFAVATRADDEAPAERALSAAHLHKQAKLARLAIQHGSAAAIAPDRPETGAAATEYELLMASFGEDLRRLKDIQSTEGKIEAKRQMIDAYTAHVDATLAATEDSGTAVQDELLVNLMIWRFDIGDFTRGLDIAAHVLRFGLRLPERFQRSPATLIAEETAEAAIRAEKVDRDFDVGILQRAEELTTGHDMPDQVKAKLQKALGLHFLRLASKADDNPETTAAGAPRAARAAALTHLKRALELDRKIGVIKDIERVTAWLNKHAHADDVQSETDEDEQE